MFKCDETLIIWAHCGARCDRERSIEREGMEVMEVARPQKKAKIWSCAACRGGHKAHTYIEGACSKWLVEKGDVKQEKRKKRKTSAPASDVPVNHELLAHLLKPDGIEGDDAAVAAAAAAAAAAVDEMSVNAGMYRVREIKKHRLIRKVRHYLVSWEGWPDSASTWEPEEHIPDWLVANYLARLEDGGGWGGKHDFVTGHGRRKIAHMCGKSKHIKGADAAAFTAAATAAAAAAAAATASAAAAAGSGSCTRSRAGGAWGGTRGGLAGKVGASASHAKNGEGGGLEHLEEGLLPGVRLEPSEVVLLRSLCKLVDEHRERGSMLSKGRVLPPPWAVSEEKEGKEEEEDQEEGEGESEKDEDDEEEEEEEEEG